MGDEAGNDGALLREFVSTGGEAPFAEVVQRHHKLVLGTCFRVLGRLHDAEDTAQAVFLMLARKASALQNRASVSGWLYHAAWYLSHNALKIRRLRERSEREIGKMKEGSVDLGRTWGQIRPLLDQELHALPERYRLPLVLHYLEGRTVEEASRQLGWNAGTVASLLNRGREMLRSRLTRQGVAISGGALFALIAEHAASAAVSPAFVASTAQAATLVAAGKAVGTNLVSAQVSALVKGGLKAMMWTKIKIAAAVMAVSVAGTGGSVAAYKALGLSQEKAGRTAAADATKDLPEIPADRFGEYLSMIKPKPGEYDWHDEIPWILSIDEARRKAAEEDKPILIWKSADGNPLGAT